MKTVEVTECTNQTPLSISDGNMSKLNTPQNEKHSFLYKIQGVHLQDVHNHDAKFKYKGIKNFCSYRLHKLGTPYRLWVDRRTEAADPLLHMRFAKATQVTIRN